MADEPYLHLAFTPEFLSYGAVCPYCKKESIGICQTGDREFQITCVNRDCVMQYRSPSLDSIAINICHDFGIGLDELEKVAYEEIKGEKEGLAVKGLKCQFCNKETLAYNVEGRYNPGGNGNWYRMRCDNPECILNYVSPDPIALDKMAQELLSMKTQSNQPINYSYKITDTFYAGEYPFEKTAKEGLPKLQSLIDFGISHFIDLTEERQHLTRYSEFLPEHCTYVNLPTEDETVPCFENLKMAHDIISQSTDKVYVHCKGGYDRTGVVVATYFVYTGSTAEQAKEQYLQAAAKIRTRYKHKPLIEKSWEVLEQYKEWLASHKTEENKLKNKILGGILGLAVGDALGVPVEFKDRESLRRNPVTDMRGYGMHNQPPGTWSDDTSLTLCLLDSLAKKGFNARWKLDGNFPEPDYSDIMQKFLSWAFKGKYTAHGKFFDIGSATREALERFRNGTDPLECGGTSEQDNGNGSLMRILPLVFYIHVLISRKNMSPYAPSNRGASVFFCYTDNVSSLTHAHMRSMIACSIYAITANYLCDSYDGDNLKKAIKFGLEGAKDGWCDRGNYDEDQKEYAKELKHFKRLFQKNFAKLPEEEIKSTGYVVDTLEAALWCLLNTDNYKDCVLKAVNLGEDTDTVAAVAGGLAGMYYGVEGIPKEWLQKLARLDYIKELCEDFYRSLSRYDSEAFCSSFNPYKDWDDEEDDDE